LILHDHCLPGNNGCDRLGVEKKARRNKENYLMGGKSLPWYMLGLSDASDMFDISGTMWMVSLCFVYGMKSIWIPGYACIQPGIPYDVSLQMAPALECNYCAEWLAGRFGKEGPVSKPLII